MNRILGVLLLVPALACTSLSPPLPSEAEAVRVTRKALDVTGCKSLGTLTFEPGWHKSDPVVAARGVVASMGGNVLFDKRTGAYKRDLVAYSCPDEVANAVGAGKKAEREPVKKVEAPEGPVVLDDALWGALHRQAAKEGRTLREVLTDAADQYLARQGVVRPR